MTNARQDDEKEREAERNGQVASRMYRRNGRYYLDIRDQGKGRVALIPEGKTYATKDEMVALNLAGKLIAEFMRPERERHFGVTVKAQRIGVIARKWLAHARELRGDGFAGEKTIRRYEQGLRQLFRVMDQDRDAHTFSRREIKTILVDLKTGDASAGWSGLSKSSLHQVITAMQLVYDFAEDEEAVPAEYNPWRKLRKQDRPQLPKQTKTDFLEIYEGHALLQACDHLVDTQIPALELMGTYLHTGGRKVEVLGLEVADIDFDRRTIRFVANRWRSIKDYDERTVPMSPALERILRRYLDRTGIKDGLLFPGASNSGTKQMITSYFKAFDKATRIAVSSLGTVYGPRLEAKAVHPRMFRVTFCSARLQTLDGGKPIAQKTVESEMGHNTAKLIASVYGRLGTVRYRGEHVEYLSRKELGLRDED